jgi:hypothetical protein
MTEAHEMDAEHDGNKAEKRKTLDTFDNAKFSCFHVRTIVVTGIGFFTVSQFFFNSIANKTIKLTFFKGFI